LGLTYGAPQTLDEDHNQNKGKHNGEEFPDEFPVDVRGKDQNYHHQEHNSLVEDVLPNQNEGADQKHKQELNPNIQTAKKRGP
jgi:hypothetical protein